MNKSGLIQINTGKKKERSNLLRIIYISLCSLASIIACIIGAILIKYFLLLSVTLISNSSYFKISNIMIRCNDDRIRDEALLVSGIDKGQSILRQNIKDLRLRMLRHPAVLDARIKRMLPDTIIIDVTVREPMAIALLDKLYYVDSNGNPYKQVGILDNCDYPVITGVLDGDLGKTEERLRNAVRILNMVKSSPEAMFAQSISELHFIDERFVCLYKKDLKAKMMLYVPALGEELSLINAAVRYLRDKGVLHKVTQLVPYHKGGVGVTLAGGF